VLTLELLLELVTLGLRQGELRLPWLLHGLEHEPVRLRLARSLGSRRLGVQFGAQISPRSRHLTAADSAQRAAGVRGPIKARAALARTA
jgi:hypothetical protein